MEWLWTWRGRFLGFREDDNLWTYDGKFIGKFYDNEVYAANGRYLGELLDGRLISNQNKRLKVSGGCARSGNRNGCTKYADCIAYAIFNGYDDFPI